MTKIAYSASVIRCGIDQSHTRIEKSRRILDASYHAIGTARQAINTSRARLQALPERSIDADNKIANHNAIVVMNIDTIAERSDDLIAAYVAARETGDEAGVEVFGKALEIIGRHLAKELGPKAAGVVMN
ncbi:hypothetical protein [Methylobacterium sp. WL8]|uniref:hypothetical protein n=1 Tax=Methylobacterium sp. WL8 TaxID=2603899 RepID=UPI0011C9EC90|nr:hypothetical protein [Methylobacterium sp. WL8]TXN80290.1 hypothetical protein FV234_17520 [Methylobacterium sp. WL8]